MRRGAGLVVLDGGGRATMDVPLTTKVPVVTFTVPSSLPLGMRILPESLSGSVELASDTLPNLAPFSGRKRPALDSRTREGGKQGGKRIGVDGFGQIACHASSNVGFAVAGQGIGGYGKSRGGTVGARGRA